MSRIFLALGLLLSGCGAEIGDACETSVDCSPDGDRVCDLAQEGGYCTVESCTPDSCPDDALCVEFGSEPRFHRRYCMAACSSSSDCRGGSYECVSPGSVDARLMDEDRSGRACFSSSEVQ